MPSVNVILPLTERETDRLDVVFIISSLSRESVVYGRRKRRIRKPIGFLIPSGILSALLLRKKNFLLREHRRPGDDIRRRIRGVKRTRRTRGSREKTKKERSILWYRTVYVGIRLFDIFATSSCIGSPSIASIPRRVRVPSSPSSRDCIHFAR